LADALGTPPPWVPYATPGYELGRAVAGAAYASQARFGHPVATLVLANHGFIAAAASAAEVMALTETLVKLGEHCFGPLPGDARATRAPPLALTAWAHGLAAALARRYKLAPGGVSVRPVQRPLLQAAAAEPDRWLLAGPLVPDDVVYGGHRVWCADPGRSPEAWLDEAPEAWPQTGRLMVALAGLGVVLAGPSTAFLEAMEENLLAHVLVRQLIARRGIAQPLPAAEIDYLLSMESEKYRQTVAAR
jgi:rhamnose utilization protein RhaD (predicted bifunctional aldolase and dehydrogenase)